jgi:hypothetical protein
VCALTGPSISHPLTDTAKKFLPAALILLRLAGEPPAHHGKELCDSLGIGTLARNLATRQLYRRRLVSSTAAVHASMHSSSLEAPSFLEAPSPRRCQSHRVRLADGSYMIVHRVRLADGSYIAPISRDDFSENFTPSLPHHQRETQSMYWGNTPKG